MRKKAIRRRYGSSITSRNGNGVRGVAGETRQAMRPCHRANLIEKCPKYCYKTRFMKNLCHIPVRQIGPMHTFYGPFFLTPP